LIVWLGEFGNTPGINGNAGKVIRELFSEQG
jgi:hypothetical protein